MADTKLTIFQADATTAAIDYRTESTNGDGRQVIVLGDSVSNNAVAAVMASDPTSALEGLVVRDVNTSAIVSRLGTTLFVSLDPGHLLGSVTANAGTGTFTVGFDPGHELGSIKQINTSVAVFFDRGNPSVNINSQTSTIAVSLDPGHLLGSVTANAGTGSFNVQFDPGHTLGKVDAGLGTFNVQLDPGHTLGAITSVNSITSSVNVQFDPGHTLGKVEPGVGTFQIFLPDTGHTLGKVDAGLGTFNVQLDPGHTIGNIGTIATLTNTATVKFDPGYTLGKVDQGVASPTQAWLVNESRTASIFTVSGSTSGVSVSGVQLVAPSAAYNFKVYAFSLQTTGIVSVVARFTNGGGSATEFWRGLVTANQTSSAPIGANLAVPPPSYLFATGTSTTLALHLDTATLVHYSVSYIKESA